MLLGAADACVILLSFAAEDCESYWRGCIQAAIVICQQIFALSALLIFLLFLLFKVLQNCLFSALASRSVLELLLPTLLRVVLLCFATQSLQIAL